MKLTWKIFIHIEKAADFSYRTLINVSVCRIRVSSITVSVVLHARRSANVGALMIERVAMNSRYWFIEPNAMRHPDLEFPRFILSESFIARSAPCERVRWRRMEFRRSHLLFPGRARRVRGVTSTSRICNKEDRCDGRNIAREANLLLFHFARSSSLIRYSLESTLFHRQSDMLRAAFRCERLGNVRGSIRNANLLLLPPLQ